LIDEIGWPKRGVASTSMHGFAQPEDRFPPASTEDAIAGADPSSAVEAVDSIGAVGDNSNGNRALAEMELDSALQLLVERAQYITGATGTALALPQGEEMVCRASAGSSAPAVGARLQVRSGLTGESIARRQLLRCDNAETDPRVNLDACRALGIASIVVLPLLRRNGDVRGLFELFSDHPYAFEERDLIALERMAGLTLTALDLAEQRQDSAPTPIPEPEIQVESPAAISAPQASAIPLDVPLNIPVNPESAEPTVLPAEPPVISSSPPVPVTEPVEAPEMAPEPAPASVPEAMLRVQKCASCGFPVSEGRALCLDCEKKDSEKKNLEKKQREKDLLEKEQREIMPREPEQEASSASAEPMPEEFVPAFLANSVPAQESWLANHVNLLAVVVLILGILVAVVVFR
jgi:putative methionine-R-sulfoxide reductase with GAF domain